MHGSKADPHIRVKEWGAMARKIEANRLRATGKFEAIKEGLEDAADEETYGGEKPEVSECS